MSKKIKKLLKPSIEPIVTFEVKPSPHSAAPWTIEDGIIMDAKGDHVADVLYPRDELLICLAPEMLRMLRDLADRNGDDDLHELLERLKDC